MQPVTFISNNVNKKCRCCLKDGIYSHSYEQYKEKFKESLNLLLTCDLRLPQAMCNSCVDTFNEVNKFRDMVMAAERQLLQTLKSNTSYDSVCNTQVQDIFNEKEESDIETDGNIYEDEDSIFQPSSVPSSDDSDVNTEVKSENEELSIMIGSTVVKRLLKRRTSSASDQSKIAVRTSPRKRDETRSDIKTKKPNPLSVQSGEMSDSESDMPLSDVKEKNNQEMNKHVEYSLVTERNKSNISTGKTRCPKTQDKLEPNFPRSIKINPYIVVFGANPNYEIRQNIILTVQHSTIIPFQSHVQYPYNYRCYYCRKLFQKMNELREHTEYQHVGKVSDKDLLKLMNYRSHTLINADISSIKCRICNEQSSTVESFTEHLTNVHEKKYHDTDMKGHGIFGFDLSSDDLICHLCDKTFDRFLKLSSHMNEHYENYVCSVCGKTFATELRYKEHIKVHRGKRKCDHCDASFNSKAGFRYHMQRQHFNGVVQCNQCPETFTQYNMKDKHVREVHGFVRTASCASQTRNSQCDLCQNGKVFTSTGLYRHKMYGCPLQDHVPRIVCEICGYKTKIKSAMKQHTDVHNGVKNFECEICGKRFSKRTTLRVHLRMHNNDKRFVCKICDAAFVQKNSLNFHMKSKHKG